MRENIIGLLVGLYARDINLIPIWEIFPIVVPCIWVNVKDHMRLKFVVSQKYSIVMSYETH